MNRREELRKNLENRNFVKIIAGINNFDLENIKKVVTAAQMGNASAVDVAAREDIFRLAKELTDLPVFVSSVRAEELALAKEWGADALEVGNFDALYAEGARITAGEVLEITKKTRELAGNDIFLSVTVPGHIEINEQIELTKNLEELNVDLIQTEGAAIANPVSAGARGLLEKAHISIANTMELTRNTDIAIMTASGISSSTAALAIAAGANGIGVGSSVNKLNSEIGMLAEVKSVMDSVNKIRIEKREEITL